MMEIMNMNDKTSQNSLKSTSKINLSDHQTENLKIARKINKN